MLLSNTSVEHLERISCENETVQIGTVLSENSLSDNFLNAVAYKNLTSVAKRGEKALRPATFNKSIVFRSNGNIYNKHWSKTYWCPSNYALKTPIS